MKRAPLLALLLPLAAAGDDTQVLPQGVFLLDVQYSRSRLDKQWDGQRRAQPLIAEIVRTEPGGGLQGVITARPGVDYDWLIAQLLYGVTPELTVGAIVPVSLRTRIDTHLGWREGDYQSQLGRPYSEEDFWQWAESMGQPRPASRWEGNRGALADVVLAARWRMPRWQLLERAGVTAAASLSIALPTGRNADPEELVASGTNGWDLHSFGDAELHVSAKRSVWRDEADVERAGIGLDVFYAWLRPRTFQTPSGSRNPLLLGYRPYVGETYAIDGGDWVGATVALDAALIAGPAVASPLSDEPLLSVTASWSYVATGQTDWRSESPLWEYERERFWQPGEKHIFRANLFVTLLRLGVPLQLYGLVRSQELIPGRYTRPSFVAGGGLRLLAKFW